MAPELPLALVLGLVLVLGWPVLCVGDAVEECGFFPWVSDLVGLDKRRESVPSVFVDYRHHYFQC